MKLYVRYYYIILTTRITAAVEQYTRKLYKARPKLFIGYYHINWNRLQLQRSCVSRMVGSMRIRLYIG